MSASISEKLLQAWLEMSLCIRTNRILSGLSFNEISVCNILYSSADDNIEVTATELCERTRLLKSQMNKILTEMEKKGIIERIRSNDDRRKVCIKLSRTGLSVYSEEHGKILKIMDVVTKDMGEVKAKELTNSLIKATKAVERLTVKGE